MLLPAVNKWLHKWLTVYWYKEWACFLTVGSLYKIGSSEFWGCDFPFPDLPALMSCSHTQIKDGYKNYWAWRLYTGIHIILLYHSLVKEGPLWIFCPLILQFCLDFQLRSKTDLKERPPSTSIANRDFTLSSKLAWVCGLHTVRG